MWQSGTGAAFSCSELTEHTRTNGSVIERFLPVRFALEVEGSQRVVKAARVATV